MKQCVAYFMEFLPAVSLSESSRQTLGERLLAVLHARAKVPMRLGGETDGHFNSPEATDCFLDPDF